MILWFNQFFTAFLYRNAAVAVVVLAVLLVRLLLKKFPKKYAYALWGVVALRMLLGFDIPSQLSLFNAFTYAPRAELVTERDADAYTAADADEAQAFKQAEGAQSANDADAPLSDSSAIDTESRISGAQLAVSDIEQPAEAAGELKEPFSFVQRALFAAGCLWALGAAALLVGGAVSYIRCKRRTRCAVRLRDNIWECDALPSPFVLGIVRARIYIPFHLSAEEYQYVVAHEKHHIKRKDPAVKLLAFLLLAVYWFNPFAWAAYLCMGKDMEMSCDEAVIAALGSDRKKAYSRSLLTFAVEKRTFFFSPLAFGESDASKRIRNVLGYKKPKLWAALVAALAVAAVGVSCLTSRAEEQTDGTQETLADASAGTEEKEQTEEEKEAAEEEQETEPIVFLSGEMSEFVTTNELDAVRYWSVEKDLTGDGILDEAEIYFLSASTAAWIFTNPTVLATNHTYVYVEISDGASGALLYDKVYTKDLENNGQLSLVTDSDAWFLLESACTDQEGVGSFTASIISLSGGIQSTVDTIDVSYQTTAETYLQTFLDGGVPASRDEACLNFRNYVRAWYKDSILLAAINMDLGEYSDQEIKLLSGEASVYSMEDYYEALWDVNAPNFTLMAFGDLFGCETLMVEEEPVYVIPTCYYFYDKVTGGLLAETWGGGNYAVDVDGDGENELIANLVYGDGGQEATVFKREGNAIYEGDLFELLDEDYVNFYYAAQGAFYIPEKNVVEIFYHVSEEEDGYRTKQYGIDLDKIEFYETEYRID